MQTQARVLSIKEAAVALGVSEGSIKNRLKDSSIRAIRMGSRVLIPVAEIERILSGHGQ